MVPNSMPAGARSGFAYVGLLLALALSASGLAAAGVAWHTAAQRAKEADLLFIGDEFARAIAAYYEATPGPVKRFPKTLEELLLDARYPTVRRYLRKLYVDPMTGRAEWGLVATPAGITGIYSLSENEPFKNRTASSAASTPSTSPASAAASRARYSDWKFLAEVGKAMPGAPPGADGKSVVTPVSGRP